MVAKKKFNKARFQPVIHSKESIANVLIFLYEKKCTTNGMQDFKFSDFAVHLYFMLSKMTLVPKLSKNTIKRLHCTKLQKIFDKNIKNTEGFLAKLQLIKDGNYITFPLLDQRYVQLGRMVEPSIEVIAAAPAKMDL